MPEHSRTETRGAADVMQGLGGLLPCGSEARCRLSII